ncbi:MAG: transglutaminase family protein [Polyangia bacterium]
MHLSIVHETRYDYATPANYTIQYLRLSPPSTAQQRVLHWQLDLPGRVHSFQDGFGNTAHVMVIDKPHQEIRIRARGEVDVNDDPLPLPDSGPHRPELYMRSTELTARDETLARFAEGFRRQAAVDPMAAAETLMLAVREKVDYQPGVTEVTTPAAQAFARGAGVCQDHAHVFVACCRQLDIPSRYVSGYLAPENFALGSDGGVHGLASHAWAEAWFAGVGWQGFDVANHMRPHGRHVRLAVGLDYLDACPIRGFHRGGSGEALGAEVHMVEGGGGGRSPKLGADQQ